MTASPPTVSVVLLSYNRPDHLKLALESIRSQTCRPLEVLVVDNPSPNSDRIAEVAAGFPGVRLLRNTENTGYTGGMNLGLGSVQGTFTYLTEDDMALEPRTLEVLMAAACERREAGLIGAVVVQHESPGQILCAGGEVRWGSAFRVEMRQELPDQAVTAVSFLPGNSLLAPTALLRSLGGFRPDFFMYYEDVELCQRVLRLGNPVLLVAGTRVGHIGRTTHFSHAVSFHSEKNFAAVNILHAPFATLPMFCLRYVFWRPWRLVFSGRTSPLVVTRAWLWFLVHLPRLMLDRRRLPFPPESVAPRA